MKCPNCSETLVMAERQGVEIDYCPSCRGVWLDKGELDKIIERGAQIQFGEQSQSGHYQSGDDDRYRKQQYPYKKKRGFLGDFFDFD